jgi:sugar/nucleoside kinase (ribokinase family)
MKSYDVLVIGRNCMDHLRVIQSYPPENHKARIVSEYKEGGGQAGNAACCIKTLGGRVTLVGKVGDDDEGKFCLKRLKAFNIDRDSVEVILQGKTPRAHIFITQSTGVRTIFYETNQLPQIIPDAHLYTLYQKSRTILLDPETTYLAAWLQQIAPPSAKVIYDCERWRKGMEAMMAIADFFIPSCEFLDDAVLGLNGETLEEKMCALKERLHGELIVTCGADGAAYLSDKVYYHVPALKIKAVDTTGAGDNFHGAFAFAISRKMDIHRAVRFSVGVASLSCKAYGGRIGVPDFKQAEDAIKIIGD